MSKDSSRQVNTAFVVVGLILAAALVVGVLVGARVYFNRVALQPVSMSELPAPQADSAECAAFINDLPDRLLGHRRAEIAEPAPSGAAAWQSSSTQQITLRCGVDMPLQYNEYTETFNASGATWMRIDDPVPGSELTTWYTADRSPVVAITTDRSTVNGDPTSQIDASSLPEHEYQPAPAPLSGLPAGPADDATACGPLLEAVPDELTEGYMRTDLGGDDTVVWQAEGKDPIVLRCNVAQPDSYQPGLQLYQINDVTWFEDTENSPVPGQSVWYVLGREAIVAAYLPEADGNDAVTALSEVIGSAGPALS